MSVTGFLIFHYAISTTEVSGYTAAAVGTALLALSYHPRWERAAGSTASGRTSRTLPASGLDEEDGVTPSLRSSKSHPSDGSLACESDGEEAI